MIRPLQNRVVLGFGQRVERVDLQTLGKALSQPNAEGCKWTHQWTRTDESSRASFWGTPEPKLGKCLHHNDSDSLSRLSERQGGIA